MHHIKLFLAAATLLAGSVSMLRADSLMALNSADVSMPAAGASPITAPPGDMTAPPVGPFSPVVEIAARDDVKDKPEVLRADLNPSVSHVGASPVRPSAHRVRARSSCAHHYPPAHYRPARLAKRAGQGHLAAQRAPLWRVATREAQCSGCWKVVILGVGY